MHIENVAINTFKLILGTLLGIAGTIILLACLSILAMVLMKFLFYIC
jgi:hypothetical protein